MYRELFPLPGRSPTRLPRMPIPCFFFPTELTIAAFIRTRRQGSHREKFPLGPTSLCCVESLLLFLGRDCPSFFQAGAFRVNSLFVSMRNWACSPPQAVRSRVPVPPWFLMLDCIFFGPATCQLWNLLVMPFFLTPKDQKRTNNRWHVDPADFPSVTESVC